MEMLTEAFKFGILQDCGNLMLILRSNGRTMDEFIDWLEEKKKAINKDSIAHRDCPNCGSPVRLYRVNSKKCNQVGGDYTVQWWCRSCHWDEFSNKSIREELEPYMVK